MKIILKILLYICLIFVVVYNMVLVIQKIKSPQDIPNFLGYKNFIISSGSMEKTLSIGDIIFVKNDYSINKNDIISFREDGGVVTHRVIDIFEENGELLYKTQGDANNIPDTKLISKNEIEGKYIFKIAKIGLIIMFFQRKIGMIALLLIFFLIYFLINRNASKQNTDNKKTKLNTSSPNLDDEKENVNMLSSNLDDKKTNTNISTQKIDNENTSFSRQTAEEQTNTVIPKRKRRRKKSNEKRKTCNVNICFL